MVSAAAARSRDADPAAASANESSLYGGKPRADRTRARNPRPHSGRPELARNRRRAAPVDEYDPLPPAPDRSEAAGMKAPSPTSAVAAFVHEADLLRYTLS